MTSPHDKSSRSILDLGQPDDNLRWALAGLELVVNGLRNSHGLGDGDVEMRNLKAVKDSIDNARATLPSHELPHRITVAETMDRLSAASDAEEAARSTIGTSTLRGEERQRYIHDHDCPKAWEFFHRWSGGSKLCPSCLLCGQQAFDPAQWAIRHAELPDIYICKGCVDKARAPVSAIGTPATHPTGITFEKFMEFQPYLVDHAHVGHHIPITHEKMYLAETVRGAWIAGTQAMDPLVAACRGLISYWTRNLQNFQWEKADTHVKRINAALPSAPTDGGAKS